MSKPGPSLSPFGKQLRHWRRERGLSQLGLAQQARTTSRYISFIETGRSKPGRDVVLRLARCMDLPAPAANTLLAAAGFTPGFAEGADHGACLEPLLAAAREILDRHEPYPAYAMDARGTVHAANRAALALDPDALGRAPEAFIDLFYGPVGRERFENWADLAWSFLDRRMESAHRSGDPELLRLAERALSHLEGVPRPRPQAGPSSAPLYTNWRHEGGIISTFNTILRFDGPHADTADEIRLELMLPADAESDARLRALTAPDRAS